MKKEIEARKKALLSGKNPYSNPANLPSNLTVVTTRVTLPINFLPKGFLYNSLAKINNRIVAGTIRNLIKDYSITDYVYINFFDPYFLSKPDIPKLHFKNFHF